MADMTPDRIAEFVNVTMTSEQKILIQVVNPDGTIATTLFNDSVPKGLNFECIAAYSGNFTDVFI